MYSVDLAARDFFSAIGRPHEFVKFAGNLRVGEIAFRRVSSPEALLAYRDIVFWGDFQQNPLWGEKNFAPRAARDYKLSQDAAFAMWRKLCLLEGAGDLSEHRVYSVGTCFLGARNILREHNFADRYRNLLARFRAVVPRDKVSFAELRELGLGNLVQGFDCASFHMRDERPINTRSAARRFAYAFERTLDETQAETLVAEIEKRTGCRGTSIKWLLGKSLLPGTPARRFRKALGQLDGVDFVVTDIYHLTINAMNLGKRVFCIAESGERFSDTRDDYKKTILSEMAGRREDLIALPDRKSAKGADIARTIAERLSGSTPEPSNSRFTAAATHFKEVLRELLLAA